jgi:hypothetical protein
MKACWTVVFLPFLTQCAPDTSADPGLSLEQYHSIEPAKTLDGVKIPVMRSPSLDRKWGKPEITVLPNGGYSLYYSAPNQNFESLRIYGVPGRIDSDAPEPPSVIDVAWDNKTNNPTTKPYPQKWSTVNLLGRPVHCYALAAGGGADAPQISTVTFPIERPGFPVASYRIVSSSNLADSGAASESYLESVSF